MYVDYKALTATAQALKNAAGGNKRLLNAIEGGARLVREDRCEFVDGETVRIESDSGKTYLTGLTNCVNERTGETCPAFAVGVPCKHRAALHILRRLNEGDADGDSECGECHRRFRSVRLRPVDRGLLEPGEIVPSGACPLCGFYCYPVEKSAALAA
jgi:hypothetical protein